MMPSMKSPNQSLTTSLKLRRTWWSLRQKVQLAVPASIPTHLSYHTCHIGSWLIILYHIMSAPVYQLGANKVCLTGQLLMNAGLPGIDYRISILQYYCRHLYYHHYLSSLRLSHIYYYSNYYAMMVSNTNCANIYWNELLLTWHVCCSGCLRIWYMYSCWIQHISTFFDIYWMLE